MKMPRQAWFAATTMILLLGPSVGTQEPAHHVPGNHAGTNEPHRRVQAYWEEFEQVIASGRGFGMAFAADQHGYPGPMHAIELGDRLKLTAAQVATLERMTQAMFANARPQAARVIDAEAALRQLFRSGAVTTAKVRNAAANVERARMRLRLIHLEAHLQTREVLTDDQRRIYHEIRWSTPRSAP